MSSTENGDNPPNGKGYWKLARELMFKNNEAAIFSRCSDLVFFDMLLYQAEFCETRERFFGTQDDNSSSSEGQPRPGLLSTATSWSDLHPGGKTAEQMTEWCDEVRPKLQKYQDVLKGAMHSAARPAVEVRRLNNIQDLIGCQGVELTGLDKAVYAEQPADDIVALRREMYQDPVSEFIARNLFPSIAHIFSRKPKKTANGEFQKFRGAVIQVFGSALSTVSAAGYLIAAIVTLYYTPSMSSKLAVIAIFTFFHALILSFFRPTNVDSINAVSTFAAVEIFFISTNASSLNITVPMH